MTPVIRPNDMQKSSASVGASAHARRVSAWAAFLGQQCGLAAPAVDLLRRAAQIHHGPGLEWSSLSLDRLMTDLEPALAPARPERVIAMTPDAPWEQLFGEVGVGHSNSRPLELMCKIAEIAHCFDEVIESLPYRELSDRDLIAEMESLFPGSESAAIIAKIPGRNPLDRRDIIALAESFPISQASAADLWHLAADEDPQPRAMEDLASRDAVLAGILLKAANVAEFSLLAPISTVRKAILQLGVLKARKLMVAALLRPVFRSNAQKLLWNHSLDAVRASEMLCDLSSGLQREEVFLVSLVHDIGRAVLVARNDRQTQLYEEMITEVAEVTAVEQFLFGQDHGSIGETILDGWHFPERLRSAVRNHHQPEVFSDPATHALYLVEFLTGSGEDIPSIGRLSSSARALGIPVQDVLQCATAASQSSWNVLRYAT